MKMINLKKIHASTVWGLGWGGDGEKQKGRLELDPRTRKPRLSNWKMPQPNWRWLLLFYASQPNARIINGFCCVFFVFLKYNPHAVFLQLNSTNERLNIPYTTKQCRIINSKQIYNEINDNWTLEISLFTLKRIVTWHLISSYSKNEYEQSTLLKVLLMALTWQLIICQERRQLIL